MYIIVGLNRDMCQLCTLMLELGEICATYVPPPIDLTHLDRGLESDTCYEENDTGNNYRVRLEF